MFYDKPLMSQVTLTIANLELSSQQNYGCRFSVLGRTNGFEFAFLDNLNLGNLSTGTCLFQPVSDDVIPINIGKILRTV